MKTFYEIPGHFAINLSMVLKIGPVEKTYQEYAGQGAWAFTIFYINKGNDLIRYKSEAEAITVRNELLGECSKPFDINWDA